ncbi:hypothetical protein ACB092_11G191100 [Castanea dentata]
MESNGKGVSIDGVLLPFEAGEIDFGEPGTNGQLNSVLDEKIYQIYKDLLTRVTKFEELVAVGGRLLAGFQEGLEYLRRPPIDRASKLVENIIKANETKRVKSYFEASCINTHDGVHSISKLCAAQFGFQLFKAVYQGSIFT